MMQWKSRSKMYVFVYPLNNPGGVQTLLLRICEWMCKMWYKVACIAKQSKDEMLVEQIKATGAEIYY